jgi:limonene-1,2-epoxide hydrolase
MGTDPRELVREFFAAWSAHDPARVADFFTEDGVYHNIPMESVQGREAIRELVAGWLSQMGDVDFRFENLLIEGDIIMMERFDLIPGPDGVVRELGVMGIMELRDGQISSWREYFDLGQMVALSQ